MPETSPELQQAQDVIDVIAAQRNEALDRCVNLSVLVAKLNREIADLKKQLGEQPKPEEQPAE